jgi:hypothetical protein
MNFFKLQKAPFIIFLAILLVPLADFVVIQIFGINLNQSPGFAWPLLPAIVIMFIILPIVASGLSIFGVNLGPMGLFGSGFNNAGSTAFVVLYILIAFGFAKIINRFYSAPIH